MKDRNDREENAKHFLQLIRRSQRGVFKVYIGMIAGVGKTYRMLQEAHEMLDNGINVQIGYVETHGRVATEELLAGLPVIPRKKIYYKGKELEEMDLDAILLLRPELVVVDELAHTNVEGSRHEKRWQDVMELKKSEVIWDIVRLIRLKVITYNDLSDFSDELQNEVKSVKILPIENESCEDGKYIIEPDKEAVFKNAIDMYLKSQLKTCMLNAKASEHSARMTAMDGATENANDILQSLNIKFNRIRQGIITQEISEIVGGAEAQK